MSWQSNETGRPKEDGGHQRINISADYYTRLVLDGAENKSNLVEHSIRVLTNEKCIHLQEPRETLNASPHFKDAAFFELTPCFGNNAIRQINVSFSFLSDKGGIEFKILINDCEGTVLTEKSVTGEYSLSHAYNSGNLGLKLFEDTLRDKDRFIFRFQFRPVNSFSKAFVKHINVFVDLIDSPFAAIYLEMNKNQDFTIT